ncbi:hypothetical protein AVEN_159647-1 [Araneus ventricosus]|uniref:Uncharacterized protein n=1 Tax=Araneus ventricosus TaxID=182803 RepID=A0A4Y2FJY4_ARAVE|nr:hypothetical protein AVEN_159647-1 [Araneus ventricosus]
MVLSSKFQISLKILDQIDQQKEELFQNANSIHFINDEAKHKTCHILEVKPYEVVKRPPAGVVRKFEESVPYQVSSSSSDRGSKLRGSSQNKPSYCFKLGR